MQVDYMASMLQSGSDMHRFFSLMSKHEVYENPKSYKIYSHIDSFPDQERIRNILAAKRSLPETL